MIAPLGTSWPIVAFGTQEALENLFSVEKGYGNRRMNRGSESKSEHGFCLHTVEVHAFLMQNQCEQCWNDAGAWKNEWLSISSPFVV